MNQIQKDLDYLEWQLLYCTKDVTEQINRLNHMLIKYHEIQRLFHDKIETAKRLQIE